MNQDWYFDRDGRREGPIPAGRLKELAETGDLRPGDFVWTAGMPEWREARGVVGMIPGLSFDQTDLTPRRSNRLPAHKEGGSRMIGRQGATSKQPWYCHFAVLAMATLLCFPVTLALVWWKSTYSMRAKWVWTGTCCLMLLLIVGNDKRKREAIDRGDGDVAAIDRREGNMSSKWGFVGPTGKIITACQFDDADSFHQGLAAVKKGGKWGWIDRTGQARIPMEFEAVGSFGDGRAPVKRGEKWGYVDRTGRLVIDYLYGEWGNFENGHARVRRDGNSLYIDINGNPSTPQESRPRVLMVGHDVGARFGFEDNTGRILVNPQFDVVSDFSESEVAVVSTGRSSGIIDKHGLWIVPLQLRYHFRAFPKKP